MKRSRRKEDTVYTYHEQPVEPADETLGALPYGTPYAGVILKRDYLERSDGPGSDEQQVIARYFPDPTDDYEQYLSRLSLGGHTLQDSLKLKGESDTSSHVDKIEHPRSSRTRSETNLLSVAELRLSDMMQSHSGVTNARDDEVFMSVPLKRDDRFDSSTQDASSFYGGAYHHQMSGFLYQVNSKKKDQQTTVANTTRYDPEITMKIPNDTSTPAVNKGHQRRKKGLPEFQVRTKTACDITPDLSLSFAYALGGSSQNLCYNVPHEMMYENAVSPNPVDNPSDASSLVDFGGNSAQRPSDHKPQRSMKPPSRAVEPRRPTRIASDSCLLEESTMCDTSLQQASGVAGFCLPICGSKKLAAFVKNRKPKSRDDVPSSSQSEEPFVRKPSRFSFKRFGKSSKSSKEGSKSSKKSSSSSLNEQDNASTQLSNSFDKHTYV